jgi:hypothetical protein
MPIASGCNKTWIEHIVWRSNFMNGRVDFGDFVEAEGHIRVLPRKDPPFGPAVLFDGLAETRALHGQINTTM